jgi:hypothetical protein
MQILVTVEDLKEAPLEVQNWILGNVFKAPQVTEATLKVAAGTEPEPPKDEPPISEKEFLDNGRDLLLQPGGRELGKVLLEQFNLTRFRDCPEEHRNELNAMVVDCLPKKEQVDAGKS